MTPTRRRVLRSIGAGTTIVAVGSGVALGDDGDGGDAKVRLAHASPNAGTVGVEVEGIGSLGSFDFGQFIPGGGAYVEVPAGKYDVTLTLEDRGGAEVEFEDVEFPDGDTTFAAIGEVGVEEDTSPPDADRAFRVAPFEGALGVLDDSQARVKFVHASPDAPAVDVALYEDGERGLTLASDLSFGNQSDPVEVDAEPTYPVAVFPAGGSDPVFGPIDFDPAGDTSYTVFAEGYLTTDSEPENPDSNETEGFGVAIAASETAPFGGNDDRGRDDNEDDDDDRGRDDDEDDDDDRGRDDDDGDRGRGRGGD